MVSGVHSSLFVSVALLCLYPSQAEQTCLDKQQVLVTIRQMQQFLKGQENRFTDGIRIMKARLFALQKLMTKPTTDQPMVTSCPPLEAPKHGKMFGSKYGVDHEVHFFCQPDFQLVGSNSRLCQSNGQWTGQQTECKEVSKCASNPCQNGGTCVDTGNQYRCSCPIDWMGNSCHQPVQTAADWSAQSDSSFSRKARCAKIERTQHCSCDAGFQMSGTSEDSVCQDVNECEVYQLGGVPSLCTHTCINIPGSYRCSCPPAYRLLSDGRSCEDIDECATSQHNCTRGNTCINTGGAFQCVNPECPKTHGNVSYVKTSPFQCERNPCPMNSRSCHHAPKTISFHYLSLPSNLNTPVTLFRMATAAAPGRPGPDSLRFGIVGGNSRGQFVVQRSDRHTGELILVQPFKGPWVAEVDVDMSEYLDRTFQAKHLSRITLYVSANEF